MPSIVHALCWCVTLAVTPLTDQQQAQLQTAADGTRPWDEPALYALLQNVLRWDAGDVSGAIAPDYRAIERAPADHRGQFYMIRGQFSGVPRGESTRIGALARAGQWDERLDQWVILTDPQRDEVAVVLILDAPPTPAAGADVRVPARFYKILSDFDRSDPPRPTRYLLFVGSGARVVRADAPDGSAPLAWNTRLLFPLIAVLLIGWAAARHSVRKARRLRAREPYDDDDAPDTELQTSEKIDDPLPQDPADALNALRRDGDDA